MIPLDKLQPGMIFKYQSTLSQHLKRKDVLVLEALAITAEGPEAVNYDTRYKYGIVRQVHFFHKINSTKERIDKDLIDIGVSY